MDEKLPEELHAYRLFCEGCTLKVLAASRSVVELWQYILDHRDEDMVVLYSLRKDGVYQQIVVNPSRVVAADPFDDLPYEPNREQRRREDEAARGRMSLGAGGRVQIGQVAKKDK